MTPQSESIHRWDSSTLLKSLMIGALFEAVLIAPAVLSPWGHAGPESVADDEESTAALVAQICVVQTLLIGLHRVRLAALEAAKEGRVR